MSVRDDDGAWRQFAYRGLPHAYYTRVAWALLELSAVTSEGRHRGAAEAQLRWALEHQNANGWLRNNSFDGTNPPFTHTIVYAAEGLLGAGALLEDPNLVASAIE